MQEIPVVLFGRAYWDRVVDWKLLADEGVVSDEHLGLFEYAETPEEAWNLIRRFHAERGRPPPRGPDPGGA